MGCAWGYLEISNRTINNLQRVPHLSLDEFKKVRIAHAAEIGSLIDILCLRRDRSVHQSSSEDTIVKTHLSLCSSDDAECNFSTDLSDTLNAGIEEFVSLFLRSEGVGKGKGGRLDHFVSHRASFGQNAAQAETYEEIG